MRQRSRCKLPVKPRTYINAMSLRDTHSWKLVSYSSREIQGNRMFMTVRFIKVHVTDEITLQTDSKSVNLQYNQSNLYHMKI